MRRLDSTDWAIAALAIAFAFGLFNHGLVPSMEPRFAEVVREMIANREWLVPIKNGRPYVEYPVFYYWLAIVAKLAGLPMTAAIRLPGYVAFFGWVYLLKRWQAFISPGIHPNSYALAGAAIPLALFQFSIAQTDGLLVFGVLLAMYGYTMRVSGKGEPRFPWEIWIGAAVATLAKGPVGIACTLPVILADQLLNAGSDWRRAGRAGFGALAAEIYRRLGSAGWGRGLAIVLLVTVPWYLLAGAAKGWEFVEAVLIYQNFDRYVSGYSHWQPWWYYFKTVVYDFFPMSFVLPIGLWVASQQFRRPHLRFVLIWALFTFAFFSVSGSKQGKYLMPAAPAFIALAFLAVATIREKSGTDLWPWLRRWSIGLILLWTVAIVAVVPFYSAQLGGRDGFGPIKEQLATAPGRLIHFQWPRSLTLYELGAPMPVVRSARELYFRIKSGDIQPGDYVLVKESELGATTEVAPARSLVPYPNEEFFDEILRGDIEKRVVLLRVKPGTESAEIPDTPEPVALHWREELFDTD